MSQKCRNVKKDNIVKENISGTFGNFGKVQLRTLEISEYFLGFLDSVDGITEEYVQAFII
jgi:hypothetical protein